VQYPSENCDMKLCMFALFAAASISSRVAFFTACPMLSAMVPENRTGSWPGGGGGEKRANNSNYD
jgi:hypothetical protein